MKTPHNIEVEQSVLGCLLSQNKLITEYLSEADGDLFYEPVHQRLFDWIKEAVECGQSADVQTLRPLVEAHDGFKKIGGGLYLVRLTGNALASNFKPHLSTLRSLAARRVALSALQEASEAIADEGGLSTDASEVLSEVQGKLYAAQAKAETRPASIPFINAYTAALSDAAAASQAGKAIGLSTGLNALDREIGAMGKSEMIVLAGRPSMGKTALALNIAAKAAMRGEGVVFGSLEMTGAALAQRVISQFASSQIRVPYFQMRNGWLNDAQWDAIKEAHNRIEALPLEITDLRRRTIGGLRSGIEQSINRLRGVGGMKLLVIDYLQLIDPVGTYRAGDTVGRVSRASEAVKRMAVDYDVPVLVLSQLSRQVEMRDPPIPMLSDLRESGAIEQDADVATFCYRPEYYQERKVAAAAGSNKVSEQADLEAGLAAVRNKMEIIIAKQRGGPTGTCSVYCDVATNMVCDHADKPQYTPDQEYAL